jgi:hypothetical protein
MAWNERVQQPTHYRQDTWPMNPEKEDFRPFRDVSGVFFANRKTLLATCSGAHALVHSDVLTGR